jgi:hypothetical protein
MKAQMGDLQKFSMIEPTVPAQSQFSQHTQQKGNG